MQKSTPEYRVDHLDCPLNPGKLRAVRDLVQTLRRTAGREARAQWRSFQESRQTRFEHAPRKGWTRPWIANKTVMAIHGQMVMTQVAGALQGFVGNVQNTYQSLVVHAQLPPSIRHQLHSINRRHAWFQPGEFWVEQELARTPGAGVSKSSPKVTSGTKTHKVLVSPEVRALARTLWRRAMSQHRKPHFKRWNPWVDQRGVFLQKNHTAQHDLWMILGLLQPGERVAVPVRAHQGLGRRQAVVGHANALAAAGSRHDRVLHGLKTALGCDAPGGVRDAADLRKALSDDVERNPHPAPYALARTVQLLLAEDGKSLKIGVCTDMRHVFEQSRAVYVPRCDGVALDLGLTTLFGTSDGDLLGRNWKTQLERFDRVISSIARHRQRLGLKVSSERYRYHLKRLRGFIKTEVNRALNRLVAHRKPARLVLEALDFQDARLSRRLNRLIRNFGQGVIRTKLRDLELQFGITAEFREAAYSSQECHACGYVDAKNRPRQAEFECRFCGKKSHADVSAARVVRDRRSVPAPFSGTRHRLRTALLHRTRAFEERFTRPRGGPADPRWTNPYFAGWAKRVRSAEFLSGFQVPIPVGLAST